MLGTHGRSVVNETGDAMFSAEGERRKSTLCVHECTLVNVLVCWILTAIAVGYGYFAHN